MHSRTASIFLSILSASLLACDGGSDVGGGTDDLVLRNVTIVSPEREAPLTDAWLAIRDGMISATGEGEPALDASWSDAAIVDGQGRYLTPGLIDSHVHLLAVPGFPFPTPPELVDLEKSYRAQLPRSYLYFGFTTLIDLNVVDRAVLDSFEDTPLHPDLYDCGGALVTANGYPMIYLAPEERFHMVRNFLYDEAQADSIPDIFAPEDHTPAAAVRRVIGEGGICIKTYWERGFGGQRNLPTPTQETIEAITGIGHDNGLTVTMHANSFDAYSFAAETDVDVLVHGLWNWGEHSPAAGVPPAIADVLDRIIDKGIGIMPTMQVLIGMRMQFDGEFLADPLLGHALPAGMIEWYGTDAGRWFTDEIRLEFDGLEDARVLEIMDREGGGRAASRRFVRYLAERDARILFGSDTPSSPTYGNPPGLNGFFEMKNLVAAGVSLRKLFEAATIANARAFHLDDRYGSVEAGKVANLLLLDENPLESVDAWNSIDTILLHGKRIERSSLSAAGTREF